MQPQLSGSCAMLATNLDVEMLEGREIVQIFPGSTFDKDLPCKLSGFPRQAIVGGWEEEIR